MAADPRQHRHRRRSGTRAVWRQERRLRLHPPRGHRVRQAPRHVERRLHRRLGPRVDGCPPTVDDVDERPDLQDGARPVTDPDRSRDLDSRQGVRRLTARPLEVLSTRSTSRTTSRRRRTETCSSQRTRVGSAIRACRRGLAKTTAPTLGGDLTSWVPLSRTTDEGRRCGCDQALDENRDTTRSRRRSTDSSAGVSD